MRRRAIVVAVALAASASVAVAADKKPDGMKQLYSIYKDECASSGNSSPTHFSIAGQEKLEKVKAKYNKAAFEKVCVEVAEKVNRDPNMAVQTPISFEAFKKRVQK